jgi:hypothetical protein
MGGSRFRVMTKTPLKIMPRKRRGKKVCRRKWHIAKRMLEARIDEPMGMNLVRLAKRKPLKMSSSQIGAHTETTTKYATFVIQSPP